MAQVLLAVTDLDGHRVRLFADTSKPTLVIFVRTDCPISNRYAPEVRRLYQDYGSRVNMYLIYPDPTETTDAIRKHIAEFDYRLTPLRDPDRRLVRKAKARVTPEAALFSSNGDLVYHGRIDDRYVDFGKLRDHPTQYDLQNALDAILSGTLLKSSSTRAIGCFLADMK